MVDAYRATEVAEALAGLVTGESSSVVSEILDPVPNFWDVVDYGDAAGEIRYSKMIGWLLDPQENHGLGASFAQAFLDAAYGPQNAPRVSPRARVHPREWRSIDVLLVDYDDDGRPQLTLAIENKTDTIEHPRSGLNVGQTRWYNWVVRGDFASILAAITASSLEEDAKELRRRRVRRWEAEAGDYREVPDAGRHFVYLTPREGEVAEDPEFRSLTYRQLESLLAAAEADLGERGRGDAEKIVRDFRRTIHRRYDGALGRQITALFGDDDSDASLAPELAGLANALGLVDEEHQRPGDDEYLEAARELPDAGNGIRIRVNEIIGAELSEMQFGRLIEQVWRHRARRRFNDTSKFYWNGDRTRRLKKIEVLQKIVLRFAAERGITTIADFDRQFGAVVARVVGAPPGNAFTGVNIVIDPDVYAYSPSAATKYRHKEIALRDDMGALILEDGRYRVSWQVGYRSAAQAGRNIHLPLIQHFAASGYPIAEAE